MQKSTDQDRKDMLVAIPAAALFIVIGIVLVYAGFYFYNDIQSVRKNGIKTEGVIVRYERRGNRTISERENGMFVVPIVQFQTATGQVVVVEGKVDNTSVLQNLCETGEQVEIIYDPQNPEHAVINTFAELWFVPLLAWFIGVAFIIVPPFTIWKYYREKRTGQYQVYHQAARRKSGNLPGSAFSRMNNARSA